VTAAWLPAVPYKNDPLSPILTSPSAMVYFSGCRVSGG